MTDLEAIKSAIKDLESFIYPNDTGAEPVVVWNNGHLMFFGNIMGLRQFIQNLKNSYGIA